MPVLADLPTIRSARSGEPRPQLSAGSPELRFQLLLPSHLERPTPIAGGAAPRVERRRAASSILRALDPRNGDEPLSQFPANGRPPSIGNAHAGAREIPQDP